MTNQQPQQQQQQQPPQPPQPVQDSSLISFNTTAPQQPQQAQQAASQYYNVQNAIDHADDVKEFTIGENPYRSIVEQQNAQIAALIEQNNALNQQVVNMLQNGAQFNQQQQAQQQFIPKQQAPQQVSFPNVYQPDDLQAHPLANFNPPALSDNQDYSLEGLADQIGKRD